MTDSNKPEVKRSSSDTRLSYSSKNTIDSCEMKFYHYKVVATPKDPDFDESYEAFNFGKAFHYINEKTEHQYPKSKSELETLLVFAQTTYDLDHESKLKLKASLIKYWDLSHHSGLKCVPGGIEIEVSNPDYIGYIDAIMQDDKGSWWIVDLKTAGMTNNGLLAQLYNDEQLNLYSYFKDQIAEKLSLDPKKFMGCRYRVTLKVRTAYGKKDTDETYTKKVLAAIKTYDYIVRAEDMNPDYFYSEFLESQKASLLTRKKDIASPKKNFKSCFNYFRPCEYWSNCHKGETYTDALKRVGVK